MIALCSCCTFEGLSSSGVTNNLIVGLVSDGTCWAAERSVNALQGYFGNGTSLVAVTNSTATVANDVLPEFAVWTLIVMFTLCA